jgi:hypothetical protein
MSKLFLGLIPALLAMSANANAAGAPVWKVSEVSGDVRVMDGGNGRAALKGSLLASGSLITAGPGARAVLVHDKDFVIVSPNSRVRIAPAEQAKGIFQIIADYGTSLFRIEHKDMPHFGVQTPYLAAVVKGTVFSVTVSNSGASVQVTQGAVDVGTLDGGAHELVRPGMIVSVTASDRYQLRVDSDGGRTIRSSGAPAAGIVTTSPVQTASSSEGGEGPSSPAASAAVVAAPVVEPPVSLADVTHGLVQGSAAVVIASVNVSKAETHPDSGANGGSSGGSGNGGNASPPPPPAPPADNGNNGGNGNGNGGGATPPSPPPPPANNGNNGGNGNGGGATPPSPPPPPANNGNNGGNGNGNGGGATPPSPPPPPAPPANNGNNGGSGNGNGGSGDNGSGNGGSGNGGSGSGDNGSDHGNGGGATPPPPPPPADKPDPKDDKASPPPPPPPPADKPDPKDDKASPPPPPPPPAVKPDPKDDKPPRDDHSGKGK